MSVSDVNQLLKYSKCDILSGIIWANCITMFELAHKLSTPVTGQFCPVYTERSYITPSLPHNELHGPTCEVYWVNIASACPDL